MHNMVLGREFFGDQTMNAMTADPRRPRNAPRRLACTLPTLDLLPPRNPGRATLLGFFLPRTERSPGIDCRWRLNRPDCDCSATGAQHLLQGLVDILEQVKLVSDLE